MKKLLKISNLIDNIVEYLGSIANWMVLLIVLVGMFNVLLRYGGKFTNTDLFGSISKAITGEARSQNVLIEAQWYIFSVLFFLGFAYILKHGVNVRVDIFYTRWSLHTQAWIDFMGTALFLIPFCIIGIWVTYTPIIFSWGYRPESPVGPEQFLAVMNWYITAVFIAVLAFVIPHALKLPKARRETIFSIAMALYLVVVVGAFVYFSLRSFYQFDSLAQLLSFKSNLILTGAWESSPDPGGLPRAPIKSVIVISFMFLLLQSASQILKYAAALLGYDEYFKVVRKDEELESTVSEVEARLKDIKVG